MNNKEPEAIMMIRKIRAEIHEELDGLSKEERIARIHSDAEAAKREFGLKLPKPAASVK